MLDEAESAMKRHVDHFVARAGKNVAACVAGVFNVTSPNATLVALMLNASTAAFNCRVRLLITLPPLAVIVTA